MTAQPRRRRALLIGCGTFTDAALPALRSPRHDVAEMNRVLTAAGYEVSARTDCTTRDAQRAVAAFLQSARVDDPLNLVYISTHGVQDPKGKLYFAFCDTEKRYPSATAVAAEWVRDRITDSRSKATVVLVDCCFSGGFITGMQARSGGEPDVDAIVRGLPQGSGVAVLTASGEHEVSFEDVDPATVRPSYFTEAVVDGIETGAADLNRDGRITVDELYEFVFRQVVSGPSPQRPRRLGMGEGSMVLAETTTGPAPVAPPPAAGRPQAQPVSPSVIRGALRTSSDRLTAVLQPDPADIARRRLPRIHPQIARETILGYIDWGYSTLRLNRAIPLWRSKNRETVFTDQAVYGLEDGVRLTYDELADHEITASRRTHPGHPRQGGSYETYEVHLVHPYRTLTITFASMAGAEAFARLLTLISGNSDGQGRRD